MKKITLFTFVVALAMVFTGCPAASNSNGNVKVNGVAVNSNTAVVVNSNTMPVTNTNTGMTSNSNRYNSTMTKEEYEKNKAGYETDRAGSKIGTGAEDSWLWFKTKAALTAVDELRDSTINVDVENSVVTLRGTVASKAEADKAIAAAKGVKDVKDVKSVLKIQAGDSLTNQMTGGTTDGDKKPMNNANMKK